jgi:hypothetical protein
MDRLIKILQFFRLVDENKQLSITNIMLIVMLVKLVMVKAEPLDVGALFIAALNYFGKKVVGGPAGDKGNTP